MRAEDMTFSLTPLYRQATPQVNREGLKWGGLDLQTQAVFGGFCSVLNS